MSASVVIDLDIRQGLKTGFATRFDGPGKASWRVGYRDDKRDGEQKRSRTARPRRCPVRGRRASGRRSSTRRLACSPAAKDGQELRRLCGFEGAVTASIYDGTGLTEAKTWDRDGKLVADDQFEADGSRKIRR